MAMYLLVFVIIFSCQLPLLHVIVNICIVPQSRKSNGNGVAEDVGGAMGGAMGGAVGGAMGEAMTTDVTCEFSMFSISTLFTCREISVSLLCR